MSGIYEPLQLPKSLEHVTLDFVDFDDVTVFSELTSLTSLELIDVDSSNDMLAYISKNFWNLQTFKIYCECLFQSIKSCHILF